MDSCIENMSIKEQQETIKVIKQQLINIISLNLPLGFVEAEVDACRGYKIDVNGIITAIEYAVDHEHLEELCLADLAQLVENINFYKKDLILKVNPLLPLCFKASQSNSKWFYSIDVDIKSKVIVKGFVDVFDDFIEVYDDYSDGEIEHQEPSVFEGYLYDLSILDLNRLLNIQN